MLNWLDDGHGGVDNGAAGWVPDSPEDLLNLKVTKRVYELLQNYQETRITRLSDIFVPLKERIDQAVAAGAGRFICIHHNSVENSAAKGLEVFYKPGSQNLANVVYSSILSAARAVNYDLVSRGTKPSPFFINNFPGEAILIELGFLSNADDGWFCTSPLGQLTNAYGIARGIMQLGV
jgi:N-acetylmuramoyl-L-alanine amidase